MPSKVHKLSYSRIGKLRPTLNDGLKQINVLMLKGMVGLWFANALDDCYV